VIYFLCIIGLVFFAVKREASTTTALLVAFFLSTVPLLTYHSYEAYADLPLSYYALCAAIYFQRYMTMIEINKSNDNGYLLLTGTALAIGSWTKGEGILFTVAFSFAVLFYHVRKRSTLQGSWINLVHYCIPIFIMAIPWYLFVFSNNISTGRGHENFLATSLHFEVLSVFVEQIIFSANFNVIFIFLLPLLLFGWKPIIQSDLKYLMLPLFAVIVFFIVIYLTTDNYIFVVERTAIDRNVLTFIPTMYYISALAAIKILNHFRQ
jgi:4-amino-4-deoxy-L-arabinose transferase-like glycosyltransferase